VFNDRSQASTLLVRALRAEDLDFFRALAQDKRITRYIGDGTPWTEAHVQQRFTVALNKGEGTDHEVRWFIAETYADMQIGLLALTLRDEETEVGYWIAPGWWGNGYARELVSLAVAIAQNERLRLPLIAKVHRDNGASRRVLERAGFVPYGAVQERAVHESAVHESAVQESAVPGRSLPGGVTRAATSTELTYRHPQPV
jgi:RimJ/RimL family protein N-acetyltransferase